MSLFNKLALVLGLCFLTFVWGVAAASKEIFPYRYILHVMAGIDAWGKMEETRLPQHVIAQESGATGPSPVKTLADGVSDDLILMTGGFFERPDICPRFGCTAMIMDHKGHVLHAWEADPTTLFPSEKFKGFTGQPDPLNMSVQGVDIDEDGNLIVVFQGRNVFPYQVGIAKFRWSGELDWLRMDNSHHWPTVGPDGRIYVPVSRITRDETHVAGTSQELDCENGAVFEEGVQILAPDGTELQRFWMKDMVVASDMQGLAYAVRTDCDPYHVNGIALIPPDVAGKIPGTATGDMVVSLRSSSALVMMDAETGRIKQVTSGPMVAQHSPQVLDDGSFVVFDNLGGIDTPGGTRILKLNAVAGTDQTLFPRLSSAPLAGLQSEAQGQVTFSADEQHMLVTSTLQGIVYEVDVASGETLWEYHSVSELTPFLRLTGQKAEGAGFFRMQTQGARYFSRQAYDRLETQG